MLDSLSMICCVSFILSCKVLRRELQFIYGNSNKALHKIKIITVVNLIICIIIKISLYIADLCIVSTEKAHKLEKASQPYVNMNGM